MLSVKELAPPSGSIPVVEITTGSQKQSVFQASIMSWDFNKDVEAATGEGNVELFYTDAIYSKIKKDEIFKASIGWHYPGEKKPDMYAYASGIIGDIEYKGQSITFTYKDAGYLLENTTTVSYTKKKRSYIIKDLIKKAGLKPEVSFKGVKDDVLDYSSATDSSTAEGAEGGVSGSFQSSCARCPAQYKNGKWYTTSAEKICPFCNSTNFVSVWPSTAPEGEYHCNACDADFCGICGNEKMKKSRRQIKITSGPTESSKGSTTTDKESSSTNTTTETSTETSSDDSGKTYWDMLLELCDPVGHDLQVFVWLGTCYVRPVPPQTKAVLWIDETKNLVYNTPNMQEGDPNQHNTVVVKYGEGKVPARVKVKEARLVRKYGEIVKNYTKTKFNASEAQAFALKELNKLQRDSKWLLDLTVIGSPHWYIGRWVKTKISQWALDDYYYITKIMVKISPTDKFLVDLSLTEYRPTILPSMPDESTGNEGSIDAILQAASKLRYTGSCSSSSCIIKNKGGDCFAMSDYLFEKISAIGVRCRVITYYSPYSNSKTHRSVQVYKNNNWVDISYKGFDKLFHAMSSKKNMKVLRGG